MIVRPLMSFANVPMPGTNASQNLFYQPVPLPSNVPKNFHYLAASSSWVIFAAPLDCVREMGISKETPFWDIPEQDKGKVEGRKIEFQFSFGGVPCFEFSDKGNVEDRIENSGAKDDDATPFEPSIREEWLSVDEVDEFVRSGNDR